MDVIERSKELFSEWLPQDLLEEVSTWSDFHQNFFWAYVYKRYEQIADRMVLDGIMRGLENSEGQKRRLYSGVLSAMPFKDAEMSIAPGKWFSESQLHLAMGW